MIVYFAIGLVLLACLLLAGRAFANASPATLARAVRVLAVVIGAAAVVYMIAAGRMALASLIFGGLLPLLVRWRAVARAMRNARGPAPGQQSEVSTRFLRMRLDHDTGLMSGTVLDGAHRGRELNELSTAELVGLLRTCRVEDPDSATLLESYLDKTGEEWRAAAGDAEPEAAAPAGDGPMSREEAYRILGLTPGAAPDAVKRAHRELMQKVHPDRGGSSYLAAKINQAKDLLLRT